MLAKATMKRVKETNANPRVFALAIQDGKWDTTILSFFVLACYNLQ